MSDSRIDYQPLHAEAVDSPTYQRFAEPPDTLGTYFSHRDDADDDEGTHASEVQGLVSPSERDIANHFRRLHGDSTDERLNSTEATSSWTIKIQAFFCAALLGISSHFTLHMTGPLKDVLKENMGITNTQFSLLQSALTLFPTITPLLGGLLVERYGTGPSSIVFTTIVIAGQTVVVIGCWTHSVKIMITGFIIFGLGAAPISLIQETMWVRYFRNNSLALVLAMGLTTGKLAGFLALATSVPLSTLPPFGFTTPFVLSLAISVFAWAMNIVFLVLLKKPKEGLDAMTKITILLKAKRTNIGWREVYGFSTMFWTLLTISFFVGASWNPFMHQASNIIKHRYGLSDQQAGWDASITLAVPLITYPLLGTFIDHAGKRAWLLLVTAGLLISTHVLLFIPFEAIPIPPTIPMLLFAFSLSLGTLSIVTSMPILTKHVPTGLGLHRSIDNIGATLFGTIAGMLQDSTPDGESDIEGFFDKIYHHFFPVQVDKAEQEREDIQLLGMFLAIALFAFISCSVFVWGDYHWTDGEGGKTGLVNGIYGRREDSRRGDGRARRSHRRRSHEVLEAMTREPVFDLEDELDAEEVSMTEIDSGDITFHSSVLQTEVNERRMAQGTELPHNIEGAYGRGQLRYDHTRDELSSEEGESDEELHDESGEYRFGVRIESGDDEVPRHKKLQAHFWVIRLQRGLGSKGVARLCRALTAEKYYIKLSGTRLSQQAERLPGAGTAKFYSSEATATQEEHIAVRIQSSRARNTAGQTESNAPSTLSTVTETRRRRPKSISKNANEEKLADKAITKTSKPRKKKASEKEETAALSKEESVVKEARAKTPRTRKSSKLVESDAQALALSPASAAPVLTQLRPYQQECIDACLSNLNQGVMRQIVSLPVGSGKTVIFSHLMKKVPPPFPGANKTLILAHRQELLEQTRLHVLRNGSGLTVSLDQGNRHADMRADVIVASVPSLGRSGTTRLLKYNPKEFKCIIIDEAHHAAAESYGRILEHFGAHVPETHIFVYGCSATVRRHDGLRLGGVFDFISFHKSFITMIEDKWLCGLRVSTIQTDFDLQDVRTSGGDFVQKDLSAKVNNPARNDIIVRSYMTYCAERKSTVVFAVDIEHLETLAGVFRKYGYDARGLSSRTSDEDRAQLLKDFRERKFPIIVNCGILTEGTDIPAIDSIIMARPTKSNVLFQQMLGRGMRLYPGKEDCLVLDFVDIVKGEGLVTLPTLLGLDASAVLNKTAAINNQEDVDAIREQEIANIEGTEPNLQYPDETETEETIDPMTGIKVAKIRVLEYENPYQLLGDCSGMPRRAWNMSTNAWVNVGPNTFVLTFKDLTFRIEKSSSDGLYRCQKRVTLKKTVADASIKSFNGSILTFQNNHAAAAAARKKQRENGEGQDAENGGRFKSKGTMLPIESDTLEDCVHGVDTWISKNIGYYPELLGRNARWRKSPASESQMRFLRKLGYDHNVPIEYTEDDKDIDLATEQMRRREAARKPLTKGQAANMITRLVNGAGKRWEEGKRFKVKHAKELAKEIGVDLGPIPKFVDV
ncbi:hypothetical protein BGX21_003955 [Mortierella sp. AD011]|nr:hypothetical protein BGX20_004349 [Mortierella sp. AD010]KAF9400594.1 hypothetical protein BGX21_003955 [Mortierella sp. AD011]